LEQTPQWYAARVAVNKELAVERHSPVEAYVPKWTSTNDGRPTKRPLIPGYTFFRCFPEQVFAASHIPGVIGWLTKVGSTSMPEVIPDSEIDTLKYAVSRSAVPEKPEDAFEIDQRVRITQGPLSGIDAVVQGRGKGYVTVGYTLFKRPLWTRLAPFEVVPV
jgi:transcription antitermination factor NusG